MAKKDDVDLDDFNLDDFNFDVPEFQADQEDDPKSRTPVTRAVKGVIKGAKDELISKQGIRKALTLALPEGYGLAADTLDNIATDTRSLYDKIAEESPEVISSSKKFGQRAMRLIGNKVLPKTAAEKLNRALEESDYGTPQSEAAIRREQEENDIAALMEIFKARADVDEARAAQDEVARAEEKALEQVRFKSNIQALNAINRSLGRLVGYQDKITAKYQMKMLELNYRMVATTKQLLDVVSINAQKQQAVLENIRKNTALPEATKIYNSEMFKHLAKQRLLGTGLNTISNWAQNYTKQVMDNVSGLVQGIVSPMAMADMGDIDKASMGGTVVGSMIGTEIRDRAAMAGSKLIAKNKYIAQGSEFLRDKLSGLPQKINEWSQTPSEGTGYRSFFTQMLKDFLPKFILDSRVGGDSVDSLDEPAIFDKMARRSLIEIIPGYLSEIAHWSKVTATGEAGTEKQVYNVVRGGFTSEKEQIRDVSRQVLTRSERESLRSAADDFIKEIGGDVLSSKAQRVLKRKLLDELANGKDLVPSRLVKPEEYPGEDYAVVEEVTSLIADVFNLDENGKMLDTSIEGKRRFNDIADQFRRMSSMIPAVGDRVRIFSDVLGKDVMRKLGFIKRDENGREDRVNFNSFWDAIINDEDNDPVSSGNTKSDPVVNSGRGKLPDRILSFVQGNSVLADSASRADQQSAEGQSSAGRSVKGLERYLGEKSTLITILRESRQFHSETVELLRQLTNCNCHGEGGQGGPSVGERVNSQISRMGSYLSAKSAQAKDLFKNKFMPKFEELKKTGKDIWIQGEDHPLLQEWKLKAGHYRDKVTGEVLTRWEDIQGDVTDLKGKIVARYDDLVNNAVFADAKGRVKGHVGKTLDKFKGSRAGAWVATAIGTGQAYLTTVGTSIDAVRQRGVKGTIDDLKKKVGDSAAYNTLTKEDRKFKPRIRRLMKFFTSDKAGADVSSELTGDKDQDMLTLALRSVQLQYETLKQVTKEKVRKGSMQDIWSRRKELMQEAKEKAQSKYNDVTGLFGKGGALAGLLDRFGGDNGDDEGDDGDDGDIYIDASRDGDDSKRRRNRNGRRGRNGRTPKPRGKLGKAWDFTKRWGNRALNLMGTFGKGLRIGGRMVGLASKAAWGLAKGAGWLGWNALKLGGRVLGSQMVRTGLGFAARAALGVLAGAAGLISAPVLAVISTTAGVVTLGSLIYGAMKDKLPLLARMRFIQYGVKPDPESKEVAQLAQMEKLASQHVKVSEDGKAEIDLTAIPIEQITKIFGVEMPEGSDPRENEHFVRVGQFLYGRFREVYLTHVSNYYQLTKSTDISQVDLKVTGKAAVKFFNSISMKGKEAILNRMEAPFADEDELKYDADDVMDEWEDLKEDVEEEAEKVEKAGGGSKEAAAKETAAATVSAVAAAGKSGDSESKKEGGALAGTTTTKGSLTGAGASGSMTKGAAAEESKTNYSRILGVLGIAGGAVTASITGAAFLFEAWKKTKAELDGGRPVRYRVYGLTELLESRMAQLETLENALFPMVSYNKDRQAEIKDLPAAHLVAESVFSPVGDKEAEAVYVWFYRRFIPAFLTYCTGVRARANIDAAEADKRLGAADLLEVMREVSNARDNAGISVWDVTESPWPGYVLNDDMDSVKDALYQLQLKVKEKPVQEPQVVHQGRVKNKDGEYENNDPNQVNRPEGYEKGKGSMTGNNSVQESQEKSWWESTKRFFGFGSDSKAPQQGAISRNGQSVNPTTAIGPSSLPPSSPISHPGGGTGGNINDIPEPKGDGWENSRETLMAAANMVGVDPALAASIAGVESGFRPNALPYKNPKNPSAGVLSSAASYYQVIKGTWKELMSRYASKYGIAPGTTQHDPRANALLGLEYIRENINTIKDAVKGRPVTDTDVYLAHFLGPYGAKKFLSAPPGDAAIRHVGADQASANPAIFYDRAGRPKTVAAVYSDFDAKLTKWRMPDASSVAAAMKNGGVPATTEEAPSGGGATAATEAAGITAPGETVGPQSAAVAEGSVPSLTKPVKPTVPANTVEEAPVTQADYTAQADHRQTQNTTANIAAQAAAADVQTSSQVAAQSQSFGGAERALSRLVTVNEQQLAQLIQLVQLTQAGQVAALEAAARSAESAPKGAVNTSITTQRPAPKGSVSVGRE